MGRKGLPFVQYWNFIPPPPPPPPVAYSYWRSNSGPSQEDPAVPHLPSCLPTCRMGADEGELTNSRLHPRHCLSPTAIARYWYVCGCEGLFSFIQKAHKGALYKTRMTLMSSETDGQSHCKLLKLVWTLYLKSEGKGSGWGMARVGN